MGLLAKEGREGVEMKLEKPGLLGKAVTAKTMFFWLGKRPPLIQYPAGQHPSEQGLPKAWG